MDRATRKSRDERDPDRDAGKDHHHRDRDRDNKRRHRDKHGDDEDRHHRRSPERSKDEKKRHRRSSPPDLEVSGSVERPKDEKHRRRSRTDSVERDLEPRHRDSVERPKDEKHRRRSRPDSVERDLEPRHRDSDEKHRRRSRPDSVERDLKPRHRDSDEKHRRRSRPDSIERDLEPRHRDSVERSKEEKHRERDRRHRSRTNSPDGVRDSAERGRDPRESSVDRHHHSSRKRKEHDEVEEDPDKRGKRVRPSNERRERRRFGERAEEDENVAHREERVSKDNTRGETKDAEGDEEKNGVDKEDFGYEEEKKARRERRRFSDRTKVEQNREDLGWKDNTKDDCSKSGEVKPIGMNGDTNSLFSEKSGSSAIVSQEPLTLTSKVSMTSASFGLPIPTKVSSITTTNENEGVNITRSDEVPGKSSTDGTTTSVGGRSGSLTLDALAKAKKALQLQRELKEKMKKIPVLNKLASTDAMNSQAEAKKGGVTIPTSVVASTTSASANRAQMTSGGVNLPVGAATSENATAAAGTGVVPGLTTVTNYEAVKRAQELAAKMGFRQDPEFAPLINMFPGPSAGDATVPQKPTKAPVLRLDAQGREVDEHGNVVSAPKLTNLSTLKVNINKQKKEAFQILRPDFDADTRSNSHFDPAMGIDKMKLLRPKRMTFQFVEEGRWSKQAEIIKFKSQFGEAQAKELRTKQSQLAKAKGEVDNPNLIELPDRVDRAPREKKKDDIPEIEWWDKPLLPSGTYTEIGLDRWNMEKITIYVEHPRPIEPPAEPAPPPPQPLKLTKKEQKKLKTQRRLAKEKDRQEMIRQGIIEPPKPKVKMSNLMKVLGAEATQDPTRLEMEIRSAAAEREQAHVDRNVARKLTPAERREKKERKLFGDRNTLETLVSVYKIKDLSHTQTRYRVDVNAQENRLTGAAVISDGITVVVVEGGKKSIKRYGTLMLKRINWAAAVGDGEVGAEDTEVPVNSCTLVWQGSVAKPSFRRFFVHQCRTEAAAKKVFADAGVPHYWDLAINSTDEIL